MNAIARVLQGPARARAGLTRFDAWLMAPRDAGRGLRRGVVEFLFFGIKEARACLFAGLFFFAVFAMPKSGILGLPRYDALLVYALLVQAWMSLLRNLWRRRAHSGACVR